MKVDYNHRYRCVFSRVWSPLLSDQRPSVRDWLRLNSYQGGAIVDIGAGDAYYLADLLPTIYTAVEPNPLLQKLTKQAATDIGATCSIYGSISEIIRSTAIEDAEIVLIIHGLLYLAPEEASALLSHIRAGRKRLFIVHPAPERSVSIAFERECGFEQSSKLLKLKSEILGLPTTQTCAHTHFVVPANFSTADLAFLVSHHVLDGKLDPNILNAAKKFVRKHSPGWRVGPYLKLPQSQIMEIYEPANKLRAEEVARSTSMPPH